MIENRCGAEPLDADAPLIPIVVDGVLDKFSVTLDPNLDGLTGYNFGVSAANVQSDIYLYNDDKMDMAWDAVWSSAVNVDADGWTVELRIPLSQIRYEASDDEQTWGVNFYRSRVSSNEQSYYSLVSRLKKGRVSQMGRVEGVRVSRPSRRLEVIPYVVSNMHNGPSVEPRRTLTTTISRPTRPSSVPPRSRVERRAVCRSACSAR